MTSLKLNLLFQDGSAMDEFGVAAALLPLATAFCRKLCTGVIQFAYTCIQVIFFFTPTNFHKLNFINGNFIFNNHVLKDHAVWKNQLFWESAYYLDVQRDIKSLYSDNNLSNHTRPLSVNPSSPRENHVLTFF